VCWNQLRDFSSALTTKSLCRMFRMVHTSRTYNTKGGTVKYTVMQLVSSVADPEPGSDVLLTPGSGIRDGEWVKNQDPNPG
jgi:hypothetical protein